MLLAINANNTNTVFALWNAGQLLGAWRISTDGKRTADEYVVWLDHVLGLSDHARHEVSATIVASVVPEANFNLIKLCEDYCASTPLMVGEPGVELGVKALVDRPDEVGADRLLNSIAVHDRYPGAAIVVDFGTATTFDVVDDEGNYRGGVIAPGINLSLHALEAAAAKLPAIPIRRTDTVIGTNTVACMQSGIFWGYVGLIEGLVARIKAEFGAPMQVVATGGLAPLCENATPVIGRIDHSLILWGLQLVHARNSKR